MAKKSYFTNKKKVKKYQFAGIDTEVNNTGYLNAMYNPNYYGEQAFNEQAVQSGKTAAITNARSGSESYAEQKANFENKQLEAKMNFAANTQQKDAELQQNLAQTQSQELAKVPVESFTSKLIDIGKGFRPAASKVATSVSPIGTQTIPNLSLPSLKTPGLNMFNKQAISLSKPTSSVMTPVGAPAATSGLPASAAKQGLKSTLGSTAWATPQAANIASGAGLALSIGGQLWDTLSEDSNPYEYSKKEKWGDWGGNLLSSIGTYGGLGTAFGPLGTIIGGVAGAGIGAFKAIREGKKNKKMAAELNAQKAQEEAMYQQQQDLYNQELSKQKAIYDYNRQKYRESSLMADEMLRQARLKGLTTSEFQGNMAQTGGVKKYLSGGANAKRIPGGMVVPVPGANNAVEYIGNKHSEKKIDNVSGIRPDSKTEVEDGEIEASVVTANGYPARYYFSSYLKYGGVPIATHFKNIIKNGGTQQNIQGLAQTQEYVANKNGEKDRSPNTIAPPTYISKLGGTRKYKTGGVKIYKTAGVSGEPDPIIYAAIVRLTNSRGGGVDTNPNNYRKEATKDGGYRVKHIKTNQTVEFSPQDVESLTPRYEYASSKDVIRPETEEEQKRMESRANPGFLDYAKGVFNAVTNPLDLVEYANRFGNPMDDPAGWLQDIENYQEAHPTLFNEVANIGKTLAVTSSPNPIPKYNFNIGIGRQLRADNWPVGTPRALGPKGSTKANWPNNQPVYRGASLREMPAKSPGYRSSARPQTKKMELYNKTTDLIYQPPFLVEPWPRSNFYGSTDLGGVKLKSYLRDNVDLGDDLQRGVIFDVIEEAKRKEAENENNNIQEEYYKTEEEKRAAEEIREKVRNWSRNSGSSSSRSNSTRRSNASTVTGTPSFTGSLARMASNNQNNSEQKEEKKEDEKKLNMDNDTPSVIPFDNKLAKKLIAAQILSGLPSAIAPIVGLTKKIPYPEYSDFSYSPIPSVGGAPAVSAGRVNPVNLGRVDYSNELSRADDLTLAAMNKSAEAGPQAGILNLAFLNKNYMNAKDIIARQQRENTNLAKEEGTINAGISAGNRDAAMRAQEINASNISKTSEINSNIAAKNLEASLAKYTNEVERNKIKAAIDMDMYETQMSALEALSDIPRVVTSDAIRARQGEYLAYLMSDPTSGVYQRYVDSLLGKENKKTGGLKKYTSRLGELVKTPKLKSKLI